ncbi:hypothetical protein JCM3774_000767 [Rhodotorula dairenensis]
MKRTSSEEARLAPPPSDLHRDLRTAASDSASRSANAARHETAAKYQGQSFRRPRSAAAVLPGQVVLVILSVWSSRQQRLAASTAPGHLTALPAVQYAVLAVSVTGWSLWTRHRRSSSTAAGRSSEATGPGAVPVEGQGRTAKAGSQRKRAWLAGSMAAGGATLRGLQAIQDRPEHPRLIEALETFSVPCLLALLFALRPRLLHAHNWASLPPARTVFALVGLTFLLAFLLMGTPIRASNVGASLARSVLEAGVVLLAKDGLSGEGSAAQFLQHASISALCAALALLPLTRLLSPDSPATPLASLASSPFSTMLLSTLTTCTAFFGILATSSSALTPLLALFPRNFLLLTPHMGRRSEPGVQMPWTQLGLLYLAGTVASIWTNEDLSSPWPLWGRRAASAAEEAETLDLESPAGSRPSTPPPLYRSESDDHPPHSRSAKSGRFSSLFTLSLVPFLPLVLQMVLSPLSAPDFGKSCGYLPASIRASVCPLMIPSTVPRTVDLVISYYDEDFERTRKHIADLRASPFVAAREQRVLIYNKGPQSESTLRSSLNLTAADEVVPLPNLGREGATYLSHILLHYNATAASIMSDWPEPPPAPDGLAVPASHLRHRRVLADVTYFFQPHLAWEGIAGPRLQQVTDRVGFVHFGPLIRLECGHDVRVDLKLPMTAELWNIFRGQLCQPKVGQLGGWSAQFAVTKRRILANPYERYAYVSELLEAPAGHWIHDQWGPNDSGGPSNPAFGHAVERAWPFIFGCTDARLVETCPDEESDPTKCQCLDG